MISEAACIKISHAGRASRGAGGKEGAYRAEAANAHTHTHTHTHNTHTHNTHTHTHTHTHGTYRSKATHVIALVLELEVGPASALRCLASERRLLTTR